MKIKIKSILTIFQLNLNRRKHEFNSIGKKCSHDEAQQTGKLYQSERENS